MQIDEDDKENINDVMEHLIDSVVKFKGSEDIEPEDYHVLLNVLDYARYVISGVCYKHDIIFMIEDDEDEEDE